MGRKSRLEIKESLSELQTALRSQTSLKSERRILALIRIKEGKDKRRADLASYLGISTRALERSLNRYQKEGLASFAEDLPKNRSPHKISKQVHEGLEQKVNDATNPLLGYTHAQQWVKEEFNEHIEYHTLRAHLITHFGTKLKTPRKSHVKKGTEAVEAFLKTT